ncbi:5-formyltetrahydrofolate cyclo-ligase [Halobacillus sp. ACCC02827]|uniref:5-formyltetrahydrofolate cyclo-ligase n=1 Tax=unclassified Halobacillus TaxID=2636472 RepID=UPI0002A521A7|nr:MULTISPECIES: 5-formyltetrahydrofolate cyclo-ligase [unclassified Halobacillus]ELK46214.1 5-formyltetrahydrofolate cyclo-ligase [Halobacillus sp. BAB-2008]WJE14394.1 5-formyltetrahydrofolate cyclo-ligase [Halobacillus sp. ACCC02827]
MDKTELRFRGKRLLKGIGAGDREKLEASMQENLFRSSLWKTADVIGVTLSQAHEWSTKGIIEEGWRDDKTIVIPKCFPDTKQMAFYRLEDYDQLEKVYFGLLEPDPERAEMVDKMQIDLLLVPGLLYDAEGYRIGYGGGYYDRFLEDFRGTTMMMAAEMQQQERLPIESYDQPVHYILTESGIRSTVEK